MIGRWTYPAALLAALAAALLPADALAAQHAHCDWWPTGRAPYIGRISAALARMPEVPSVEREALAARIALGDADDQVTIHRDRISGHRLLLAPAITRMSFGAGSVCQRVDRRRWPATHTETASVYRLAGSDWAVLMPDVCGNPSLVRVVGSATRGTAAIASAPAQPIWPTATPSVLGARGEVPDDPSHASSTVGGGLVVDVSALRMAELPTSTTIAPAPDPEQLQTAPSAEAPSWAGPGSAESLPMPWIVPSPIGIPTLPAPVPAVPEPPTWALLAAGGFAIWRLSKRRR